VFIQRIIATFVDHSSVFVFRKVHSVLASKVSTFYHLILQVLGMKRQNLKIAFRKHINTHSFYSVYEV